MSITYEISKESCLEFVREKVLNGQIKTKAEIIEEKVPYTYAKENEGISKDTDDKL